MPRELASARHRKAVHPRLVGALLALIVIANAAVLVWLWVHGGNLHPRTTGDALTSAGRLTGLLGAYLALIQVILLARLPIIERLVGFDRLTVWHRWNGHACLDLIVALPDDCWQVGIQHPRIADRLARVVIARDLAIATSGAYARGEHVLDPHTGRAPTGALSATITGPVLATADAYATAAFAMGLDGPAWTARLDDYETMTILADDRVLCTPGFPGE